jgi:hypothetical protein
MKDLNLTSRSLDAGCAFTASTFMFWLIPALKYLSTSRRRCCYTSHPSNPPMEVCAACLCIKFLGAPTVEEWENYSTAAADSQID